LPLDKETPMPRLTTLACLTLAFAARSVPALEVYGVAPIAKLTRDAAPSEEWTKGKMDLDCARNEWEAFQVVVRSPEAASDLAIRLTDLLGPAGATIPATGVRLYKVEWVDVNAPYEPDKPSEKPNFRPDPLPPIDPAKDRFSVEPRQNLVFWLSMSVPETARPGAYTGEVRVLQGNAPAASLTVRLRVRSFALPKRPILQSMIGFSEGNIYKAHGCKTPEEKEKIIRLYFDEYIRARLSPFLYAPGTMAFNPLPGGAIRWEFTLGADGHPTGEATLDFTGFDREGEQYLDERDAFSSFNTAPYIWGRREADGKQQIVLGFADSKGTAVERLNPDGSVNPVFDQLVVSVFRGIAEHLAAKGWLDRAVYYVTDEPSDDDTPALMQICQLVREADPRLRTALTYDPANRPRLAELVADGRSLISVWVPYCTMYREDVAAEQRAKGAEYWLYDVSTNCLIPHSGQQNRGMFWTVWQRNANGYLYYLSTWWGRDATPWERPSFMLPEFTYQYRQGDGYFFYPPLKTYDPPTPILDHVVPTLRWELMREGAEDYDYLRMLEGLVAQAEKRKLPAADRGRKALDAAHSLAETLTGASTSYGIRDLTFQATEGWTFGLEEGWLHHQAGKRSDLATEVKTTLPDGRYELVLNVYDDADYNGKPYSHFLIDGRPCATSASGAKGAENVSGGAVEVRGGACKFTISSTDDGFGVIVYRVGLKRLVGETSGGLYAVRARVADAIEALQAALSKQ
jgi:hypothetical protein